MTVLSNGRQRKVMPRLSLGLKFDNPNFGHLRLQRIWTISGHFSHFGRFEILTILCNLTNRAILTFCPLWPSFRFGPHGNFEYLGSFLQRY